MGFAVFRAHGYKPNILKCDVPGSSVLCGCTCVPMSCLSHLHVVFYGNYSPALIKMDQSGLALSSEACFAAVLIFLMFAGPPAIQDGWQVPFLGIAVLMFYSLSAML